MEALQQSESALREPMRTRVFRVRDVYQETADTFTLEMGCDKEGQPIRFLPGQFNMLYAFGVGEAAISISGDPAESGTLLHTTRRVGIVTDALSRLEPGDALGIRGPFGSPWPLDQAVGNDVVIVAGGIGLAPLRPALYQIMQNRSHYGRVVLLYGTRTPEDLLYRTEIEQWRGRLDLEVYVTVDHAATNWRGNVGVVTRLIARAPFDPLNTTTFVCGPEIMMTFTVDSLIKRGVAAEWIYVSMERNMKCAVGLCGHCQFGPLFVCREGPVFRYDEVARLLDVRDL